MNSFKSVIGKDKDATKWHYNNGKNLQLRQHVPLLKERRCNVSILLGIHTLYA